MRNQMRDAGWLITWDSGSPIPQQVADTLLTVGAGGIATRGVPEEAADVRTPGVLAAGVYDVTVPGERLLPLPCWTTLDVVPEPVAWRYTLDLRRGVLIREEIRADDPPPSSGDAPLRTVRFASVARPGVMALRATAATGRIRPGEALRAPSGTPLKRRHLDGQYWVEAGADITAATSDSVRQRRRVRTVDRVAAYVDGRSTGRRNPATRQRNPAALVRKAMRTGFDALLAEHAGVWAERWASVGVEIPDDPDAELALRYALFQLWCNVGGAADAAVGARGISGSGYDGHVFWDADVFVLPAIVSIDPGLALAMVRYRLHRLPAAMTAAAEHGHAGARFPWESASIGNDVTPKSGDLGGDIVPIRTGELEEHITADVAWSAWHYARWSGDTEFLRGQGRQLLVVTARYWASRIRLDIEGKAHIDTVIGPDEYHEAVSDNTFTNVMARWNLRTAAALTEQATGSSPETRRWRRLATALVDGYQRTTGRYEQFAGYFALEPLRMADVATPPVAADVLLGRDRVARSQLIKQPDVLMAHHIVPEEVEPGSLPSNLDYYGPRTAHGSSLSPAIGASLLARARRPDEALDELRIALRLDLDDLTGTTAGGLHIGAMGGCWQAILAGFAGVRVRDGVLCVDPVLPSAWSRLGLRFHCLGRRVRIDIRSDALDVEVEGPLRVRVGAREPVAVSGMATFPRDAQTYHGVSDETGTGSGAG